MRKRKTRFRKIGSCQIKEDLKKGGYTCKLSVNSAGTLNDIFPESSSPCTARIATRYFIDSVHTPSVVYNVVYKYGKSLKATYKK